MSTQTTLTHAHSTPIRSMYDPSFVKPAIVESFKRLAPQVQWRNPVMFVCYVGAILTLGLYGQALLGQGEAPANYILAISAWLWITVLFANFAEAMAEGRSKDRKSVV